MERPDSARHPRSPAAPGRAGPVPPADGNLLDKIVFDLGVEHERIRSRAFRSSQLCVSPPEHRLRPRHGWSVGFVRSALVC